MRAAALSLILLAILSATAVAQSNDTSNAADAPTGGWQSCADQAQRRTAEQELAACTRVLDNTQAEVWRGAAFWWRGIAQRRAGRPERADEDFASAFAAYSRYIETTPLSYQAYLLRAQLLAYLQRHDEALRDYDAADRIAPNQPTSRYGRGAVAFARGDYALAITELDAAQRMSRFRSGAGALHMSEGAYGGRRPVGQSFDPLRCTVRAAAGDLSDAEQICDRAIRESNSDPDALIARGFLRFKQGQIERAGEDFTAALRSRPDAAVALLGRGVLRLRTGDAGGAADVERAHMLDSGVAAYEAAGLRAS